MNKITRRIEYLPFQSKTWYNETITDTATEIEKRATQISWVQSCSVNICHTDEKGRGFPDETFGDWGSIRCPSEMAYLNTMR